MPKVETGRVGKQGCRLLQPLCFGFDPIPRCNSQTCDLMCEIPDSFQRLFSNHCSRTQKIIMSAFLWCKVITEGLI